MKLRMKRKAMVILAAGMLMSAAAPAAAMAAEKATGPALTASYNGDVNTLEAARDATQLIVVIGNRQDPAKSRLDWYKRDADGKLVQVMSKEAVSGMNGVPLYDGIWPEGKSGNDSAVSPDRGRRLLCG